MDELIVMREAKSNQQVCDEINALIKKNPDQHTVDFLADEIGVERHQIIYVLESMAPEEGWLPEEVADRWRKLEGDPGEDHDIGNRWPDGVLRSEVFDIMNPRHRELMGIDRFTQTPVAHIKAHLEP